MKKSGQWTRELDASLTAEAALLFPVLIFIIFCIIFMNFYLYDETSAVISLNRYALMLSGNKRAGGSREIREKLQEELERKLEERALLPHNVRVTGEDSFGGIKLSAEIILEPGNRIMKLPVQKERRYFQVYSGAMRQADRVRITDILWNLGADILAQSKEETLDTGD